MPSGRLVARPLSTVSLPRVSAYERGDECARSRARTRQGARPRVRERLATYEIISRGAEDELADVVDDLPPAEPGVVLSHKRFVLAR